MSKEADNLEGDSFEEDKNAHDLKKEKKAKHQDHHTGKKTKNPTYIDFILLNSGKLVNCLFVIRYLLFQGNSICQTV